MSEHGGSHVHESRHLPPLALRAEGFENPNGRTFERLPTPLNEIGLVDKPKLIKLVRGTLNSAYMWPSELDDEHHYQWPRRNYPYDPDLIVNPYEFRDLALNKTEWPRQFHGWTHKVTEQPQDPSMEVMYNVSQAQISIDSMHRCVQVAKMLSRNKKITEARFACRLEELLDEYHEALGELAELPPEFHFINIEQMNPESPFDLLSIKGELGRLATVPTVASTTRHIRQMTYKKTSRFAA